MRLPLLTALTVFALPLSVALAADDTEVFDALNDLPAADLSRALQESVLRLNSSSDAPVASPRPASPNAPKPEVGGPKTDLDRSLALGRALADLTAAGRARDVAALERATQALTQLGPAGEAPPVRQRREMFLQAARAGRWPMVEATVAAVRLERLRAHGTRYGTDQATLAGAGLWLRLLELSASVRCHGGAGPAQGPLVRPAPTEKLRERLVALGVEAKKDARVPRLVAQVEALAGRALPPGGAVPATEACQIKTLAAAAP